MYLIGKTRGGGLKEQFDVMKTIMEFFPIDYINKIRKKGQLDKLLEFRDLCQEKGKSWMSNLGEYSTVENLLSNLRFFLLGNLSVTCIRQDKNGHNTSMPPTDFIESLGGFVFNAKTSSLPKKYLKQYQVMIIVPHQTSKKQRTSPAYMDKAPVISGKVLEGISCGSVNCREDMEPFIVHNVTRDNYDSDNDVHLWGGGGRGRASRKKHDKLEKKIRMKQRLMFINMIKSKKPTN